MVEENFENCCTSEEAEHLLIVNKIKTTFVTPRPIRINHTLRQPINARIRFLSPVKKIVRNFILMI